MVEGMAEKGSSGNSLRDLDIDMLAQTCRSRACARRMRERPDPHGIQRGAGWELRDADGGSVSAEPTQVRTP